MVHTNFLERLYVAEVVKVFRCKALQEIWDMTMFWPDKIETENKQSVDNCLLDRVAQLLT